MKELPPSNIDFPTFAARVERAHRADPTQVARAGKTLINGALRIRTGNGGLFGQVEKPITKPAQAIHEWLKALEREANNGDPFHRSAEIREAIVAAGEEIDKAAADLPTATRLRTALYKDALGAIDAIGGDAKPSRNYLPWILTGVLGGIVIGMLLPRSSFFKKKRR